MRVEISIISGQAKGQHFMFDKPDRFLFGRSLDARVSLPNDPYVSRQHFLLEISPPECKITDLKSKNGTYVNGIRYGGRKPIEDGAKQAPADVLEVELKDGDKITVGDTQMTVMIGKEMPPPAREEQAPARPAAPGQPQKPQSSNPLGMLGQLLQDAAKKKQTENPVAPPNAASNFPQIEGYQIDSMIERGGMGMVYKARELRTNQPVAVKVMLPQMAANPENIKSFQREIDVTRQLKHPYIVQLYDHGKTDAIFYFVLEYVNGMNLHQFLTTHGGRLSLEQGAAIMLDTLDGLAYAHSAEITMQIAGGVSQTYTGVVHRDLKPQNILLGSTPQGWVGKVSDFGISKSFESAGLTNITKPGEVLGTPMYWPREQITHYKYLNPATDVFSIAAVFYEMLTGKWVREGFEALFERCKRQRRLAAISDYMNVIIGNPAIPIRQRNADIPEPVAAVLDRALQEAEVPYDEHKMRDALAKLRYPDARAFRDALLAALREAGFTEERIREGQRRLSSQETEPPDKKAAASEEDAPVRKIPDAPPNPPTDTPVDLAAPPSDGSIFYSILPLTSDRKEVALLVLDLEESSEYLREVGDTYFSNIIGKIYSRVKKHASSSELIFLKSTGGGFLAVFTSVPAAFSLALSFLKSPISSDLRVRMALHWGLVKVAPDGDVLGVEVHRAFRVENVQMQDQAEASFDGAPIPFSDRIVMTREALALMGEAVQSKFRYVGKYKLKGFEEMSDLWALQKR